MLLGIYGGGMKELIPHLVKSGIARRHAQLLVRRLHRKSSGCWGWYGHHTNGVACFGITRAKVSNQYKVHRLLFAAMHPAVDIQGLVLAPICKNLSCPNPWHRKPMTRKEFVDQADYSERRSKKINWDLVHRIRAMPASTNWAQVGRDNGISPSTVRLIRANKAWRESVQT